MWDKPAKASPQSSENTKKDSKQLAILQTLPDTKQTTHTHSFGPIHNIMQILQLQNKGAHLNTLERFHIYTEYTNDNHLNDDMTIFPNKIFDTHVRPHQS